MSSFDDLNDVDCRDAPPAAEGLRAIYYPITGRIGVEEVIREYFELLDRAKADADAANEGGGDGEEDKRKEKTIFDKNDAYVDSIVFTTTLTGEVNPSIVLNPAPNEQLTAGLSAGRSREDTHTVTISLSSPQDSDDSSSEDKITRVQLVDDDLVAKR